MEVAVSMQAGDKFDHDKHFINELRYIWCRKRVETDNEILTYSVEPKNQIIEFNLNFTWPVSKWNK